MKRKLVTLLLALSIATISITACGNKTDNNIESTEINTEIAESLPWLQLGSLESHPELRAAFEAHFGITGETGNKVGNIYYNVDTEKADQNVTLFMALKNADTRGYFTSAESVEELANIAAENYADVEADDLASAYATINAYFELLPDQEDGQFDGAATISRAQAMALLMCATTAVNEAGAPEVNKDFTSAVGESQYTDFAAPMNEFAYINIENGLTENVFNSTMTKGEYICMITNLLQSEYKAMLEAEGYNDIFADKEVSITTVTDGGDISYADAIGDVSQGVPSDMFKTFETAVKYGFITEDALEDWDASITKSEAVELFICMTDGYIHSTAKDLYTDGYQSPEELSTYELTLKESNETEMFGASLPGEGTGTAKFQAWARSQGADYASGWTFIYRHGEGAGDGATHGIYMNPDSPLYGTRYEIHDTLPNGVTLNGTLEEEEALMRDEVIKNAEEIGDVYTDPETGKIIISIGD